MRTDFEIIRDYTSQCPVRIEALANELGMPVRRLRLPEGISGKLMRIQGGFEIHVNRDHHDNRQRFTIAHEIAHYILHRDLIDHEVVDDALYRSEKFAGTSYETQANAYAADLLMPRALVNERFSQLSQMSGQNQIVEDMASRFGVSVEAMRIRLRVVKQLNLPL